MSEDTIPVTSSPGSQRQQRPVGEDLADPVKSTCVLRVSLFSVALVYCNHFAEINIISLCKEKTGIHPVSVWEVLSS